MASVRPRRAPAPEPSKPPEPGLNVLIADDSAVTRRVMAALAMTVMPEVALVEAASGTEAREALRQSPFDIAFIDFHMPGVTGPEPLPLVRHKGVAPCLVLMADTMDPAHDEAARGMGAYECLQKPLEEDELRLIVANVRRMRQRSRVIVADDSKSARRLMDKVLRRSCFAMDIETVESGEYALAALKREAAQVVFLDYDMPGIDGLETACLIQEVNPDARVIMVSASQNPAVERAARYFGAVDFIRKPFYAREVDKSMHLALNLPLTSLMIEPEPEPEPEVESADPVMEDEDAAEPADAATDPPAPPPARAAASA